MLYLIIVLMLIGPWAQAAETMTAEDAANRFCEAFNRNTTEDASGQAPYCEYEDPFFGQSSVSLYLSPARGFTMGHLLDTLDDGPMCDIFVETFANYNPPVGQEIETLRNNGWVLRLYAVQNDVSRLGNTCAL